MQILGTIAQLELNPSTEEFKLLGSPSIAVLTSVISESFSHLTSVSCIVKRYFSIDRYLVKIIIIDMTIIGVIRKDDDYYTKCHKIAVASSFFSILWQPRHSLRSRMAQKFKTSMNDIVSISSTVVTCNIFINLSRSHQNHRGCSSLRGERP